MPSIWEWHQGGGDRWSPYPPEIQTLLEKSLTRLDHAEGGGSVGSMGAGVVDVAGGPWVVNLRTMLQINTSTMFERRVRRRGIEARSSECNFVEHAPAATPVHFFLACPTN